MSWFTYQRQKWIMEMLGIYGFINREHLMRKFQISKPLASKDLQTFLQFHPGSITYNASSKRYEKPAEVDDG